MILVNISSVGTSTTLTLMPVSSSHLGPEKLSGSSACSPASQTMVISVPAYCFAASTRSEEHTSELQSLMRISYAVFCLKNKKKTNNNNTELKHTALATNIRKNNNITRATPT